jgi:hypothetical protein
MEGTSAMKTILVYLPFVLIGAAIGAGDYNIYNWEWWAWDISILASIFARDVVIGAQL